MSSQLETVANYRFVLIAACAVSAVMLMLAGGRHPYDYYVLMRFLVFCSGALAAWYFNLERETHWALAFGVAALLFNPFVPVHLSREAWEPIDWIAAALFGVGGYQVFIRGKPPAG